MLCPYLDASGVGEVYRLRLYANDTLSEQRGLPFCEMPRTHHAGC